MKFNLIHGDCIEEMKKLPENSVDSVVTDPPYELGFMGKSWDNTGIANNKEMWVECLRVLKPGGHLLAFSGTRTYHRMASAIEDAGFEVRDMIEWVYGSGFPKSLNIGKVADKFLKTGNASWNGTGDSSNGALGYSKLQHKQDYRPEDYSNRHQNKENITEEQAKQWEGWGTALKPAHEPICMARKPLSEKTVAENCLKWGTGGINIDESRVAANWKEERPESWFNSGKSKSGNPTYDGNLKSLTESTVGERLNDAGRFPANLIHDNSEEVRECFPETKSVKSQTTNERYLSGNDNTKQYGDGKLMYGKISPENTHNDSGNASRFFKSIIYQAKASKSERNRGCEGLEEKSKVFNGQSDKPSTDMKDVEKRFTTLPKANHHPTVKPIALMEYLIKMVTPKGGVVLDPFMGSGSTGVACVKNGFGFVGIEMEADYIEIAKKRIEGA